MIKLDTSYSDYVDETDPNYPNGKAIDCSTDESFDGTPILKELVNDVKGALESVVYAAEGKLSGVSGTPDNITASDFLNALKKLIDTPDKAHADLRGPNAHGATVSASASQIITRDAAGRAQVSSPAVAADIANKGWTEDQISGMAESLVNGDVNFAGKKTFNGSVEMNGPVGGTGFENRLAEKVDPPTEVTKAQYDAMTPEQKAGKYWIITDATGFNQPVIRDDLKAKDTVWSSDKTDSTINNALANLSETKVIMLQDGNVDFNTVFVNANGEKATYFIYGDSSKPNSNAPMEQNTTNFIVESVFTNGRVTQTAYHNEMQNLMYIRTKGYDNAWTEWTQIATKSDIATYVSLLDGGCNYSIHNGLCTINIAINNSTERPAWSAFGVLPRPSEGNIIFKMSNSDGQEYTFYVLASDGVIQNGSYALPTGRLTGTVTYTV